MDLMGGKESCYHEGGCWYSEGAMKGSYVELRETQFQGGEIQEEAQEGVRGQAWGREEVEVLQGRGGGEIRREAGRGEAAVVELPSGRAAAADDAGMDSRRLLHWIG